MSLEKHTMTASLLNKPFFSFFLHILFLLLHIFNSSSFFALAEHTSSTTSRFGNNNTEAEALLQWKASLHNQSQSLLSSWVGISPCINWIGITCDNSGSVTKLILESFGLRGTLYDFNFSAFPNLLFLDLANNSVSGTIPHEIGKLRNLSFLHLSMNQLSGPIPSSIGNLKSLSVGEFRHPHARTGGVLIVAHRRLKHTDTIFYVVRQNRLNPRERVHII